MLDWFARYLGRGNKTVTESEIGRFEASASNMLDDFTAFLNVSEEQIRNAVSLARQGENESLASIFRTTAHRDAHFRAMLETRKHNLSACEWDIISGDSVRAEEIRQELLNAGINGLIKQLTNADLIGYFLAVIKWGEGGKLRGFTPIAPEAIKHDTIGNAAIIAYDGEDVPVSNYMKEQFVCVNYAVNKPPAYESYLEPLAWLFLLKYFALRWRGRYVEKFGLPVIIGTLRPADFDNIDVRNKIKDQLKRVAADGVAVVKEGSMLESFSGASDSNNDIHEQYTEYLDNLMSLLMMGQIASSKEANGMSNGDIAGKMTERMIDARCYDISEIINQQVIKPLVKYKYGDDDACDTKFMLLRKVQKDTKNMAHTVKVLSEAGWVVDDPAWMAEQFGVKLVKREIETNPELGEVKDEDIEKSDAQPGADGKDQEGGTEQVQVPENREK